MILIITGQGDAHADGVVKELNKRKIPNARFHYSDFAKNQARVNLTLPNMAINLSLSERTVLTQTDKVGEIVPLVIEPQEINFNNIKAVWFQRRQVIQPIYFRSNFSSIEFIDRETKVFLDSLWYSLGDRFWVNNPYVHSVFSNKIIQLNLAEVCKLKIPETLVTNNPSLVIDFIQKHKKVIYKPLSDGYLLDIDANGFRQHSNKKINTTLISEDFILKNLNAIISAPGLFQKAIEKQFDVRVTIFGTKIFVTEIHYLGEKADIDWRKNKDQEIEYRIGKINDDITKKCLKLMNLMNIQYGAFDFLKNMEGEYIFLEVNLSGSWAWLEEETGQKMTAAMADVLEEGLTKKGLGDS
jgi:hypothetical protein